MKFNETLIAGEFIKRYKRFFVDVKIGNEEVVAHCPNTGSMMGLLKKGNNVIFDIDWQGTNQIISQKLKNRLLTFFILPPSKEVLFKRLSNRDMKDKLIAEERMKQFDTDVLHWKDYNYVIINNDLEVCYEQISYYIDCEISKKKSTYNINQIKKHISKLTS